MKVQDWIFSVRYRAETDCDLRRYAVVGPARASTVEAALRLADMPEGIRAEVRADETVRKFIDGLLDPELSGYYAPCPFPTSQSWLVCMGSDPGGALVIAPMTMDALADVARALGFELRRAEHAVPVGVDYDRAKEQTQFALLREGEIEFDGTARECSAFLIGWRDLRSSVLGAVRAVGARVPPEMSGLTRCRVVDPSDSFCERYCLLPAGHEGAHSALMRWQDLPR